MSGLQKKYYDGSQVFKILTQVITDGGLTLKLLKRFGEEPSAEPKIIRCKDCIWHLKDDSCARLYCITDDDFYCWHGRRTE